MGLYALERPLWLGKLDQLMTDLCLVVEGAGLCHDARCLELERKSLCLASNQQAHCKPSV